MITYHKIGHRYCTFNERESLSIMKLWSGSCHFKKIPGSKMVRKPTESGLHLKLAGGRDTLEREKKLGKSIKTFEES